MNASSLFNVCFVSAVVHRVPHAVQRRPADRLPREDVGFGVHPHRLGRHTVRRGSQTGENIACLKGEFTLTERERESLRVYSH